MQPEKAQEIIANLHGTNGPLAKPRNQGRTLISEAAKDGSETLHTRDGKTLYRGVRTPGDFVAIRTEVVSATSHLAAVARLGYLVTEKPDYIAPGDTDPRLQPISHSNPDTGTLTETLFIDHNPQ